jgi:hypothetical protein
MDVVVVFRPIITNKDHSGPPFLDGSYLSSLKGNPAAT